MGVDIHARAARLLQQLLQIDQIVSRNKDCRIVAHADVDLRDLRRTIARGVRRVQQRHGLHAIGTRLEHERGKRIRRKRIIQRCRQRLVDKRCDVVVRAA